MFCPRCGNQLNDGAAFCNACGANLGVAPNPAPNMNPNMNYGMRPAPKPLPYVISGKSVSAKDSNFIFIALAAVFAFFATVLMHCPVLSVGYAGQDIQVTYLMAGGGENAIGQIIFTILTFLSLAYLFVPYVRVIPLKQNIFNFIAPIAVLFFQMILFVIAGLTHGGAGMGIATLSMDGWLFWLSTIVSIGLFTFEMIRFLLKR